MLFGRQMTGKGTHSAGRSYLDLTDPNRQESLDAIISLLGLPDVENTSGWTATSARLLALDCAVITSRTRSATMSEAERRLFDELIREARRLTLQGQHQDLDFVQSEITKLIRSQVNPQAREVWISGAEALVPSPFRAAQISIESTLVMESQRDRGERRPTEFRLRDRLLARLAAGAAESGSPAVADSPSSRISAIRAGRHTA